MIQFQTTDQTEETYADLVENQSNIIGEVMDLDDFSDMFPEHEVFLEVTNNHCYRPGYVERYAEVNGRVFFLDDLNEDEAIELKISKDELIEQCREVFDADS